MHGTKKTYKDVINSPVFTSFDFGTCTIRVDLKWLGEREATMDDRKSFLQEVKSRCDAACRWLENELGTEEIAK